MKMPAKSLTQLILSAMAGIGLVSLLMPQPSFAQASDLNPIEEFDNDQNSELSPGNSNGNSFSVFDLIHRANLGTNRSWEEYSAEQQQSLDKAAEQFRTRQRHLMQGTQQATPTNPVTKTQVAN